MTQSLTGNPTLVDPGFDTPPSNPMSLFQRWLEEAEKVNVQEPRALILSTINTQMRPSSRVVFLRDCDDTGVIFATGSLSNKGKDLAANPSASGTLWWPKTIQQINFQGQAFSLSPKKSDAIFHLRTREAQSVAVASQQSTPLTNENDLKLRVLNLMNSKDKIDRPKDWQAYHLRVYTIEFWHGSTDRLHKRLRYDLVKESWQHQKLQP